MENLNGKKIHFIGIGGIGISAAARILAARGCKISGSDASRSEITDLLESEGVKVNVPQAAENITADIDLAVYTVAATTENPERIRAEEFGIKQLTYPQLLGQLMAGKFGIGIAGTDGKTTTTAMAAKILIDAGLDPTVVLGSKADFLDGNSRLGGSEYFVFEADEYRRAFANYSPRLAAITNIGLDHLDYYADQSDYSSAFADYLNTLPEDGAAIINAGSKNAVGAAQGCRAKIVTFAFGQPADYEAREAAVKDGRQEFSVMEYGVAAAKISLALPGRYNIENALAAIGITRQLGIAWDVIGKSLAGFQGTWRRFEHLGQLDGAEIIADFAHTPDAVGKVIEAAKEFYPDKKILTVFQPHQFARTKSAFDDFARSFGQADLAMLVDIYYVEGRENPDDFDVDSKKLADAALENGANVIYGGSLPDTSIRVAQLAADFDVILVLGAGSIYELAKKLVR